MVDINKFGNDIQTFRNGLLNYTHSFNSADNLFFKSNSSKLNQQFLKVDIKNLEYDNKKILKFFPIEFEEFVTREQTDSSKATLAIQNEKITDLENQVVNLQTQLEVANQSMAEKDAKNVEKLAIKDVIIELRIQNGEGKSATDFSEDFPYVSLETPE